MTKPTTATRWMLALLAGGLLAWSIFDTLTTGSMAPILDLFGWIGLAIFVVCVAPWPWTAGWPVQVRVIACILTFPSALWTYWLRGLPLPFFDW